VSLPFPRTPEDVLAELREANARNRDSRALSNALSTYSPEELGFLAKLKGGLTPQDRAINELKEMMVADMRMSLQSFIGMKSTEITQQHIDQASHTVLRVYSETFETLGITNAISVRAHKDEADPGVIHIDIEGYPWPGTP
jgi:hypothetical protein